MKELLNRLIALHKSGEKMQETALLKTNEQNVTPDWIDTLQENEIFVFGCRNSGRHFDGASNFALENFGAIMGQREGRQGQHPACDRQAQAHRPLSRRPPPQLEEGNRHPVRRFQVHRVLRRNGIRRLMHNGY